MFSNSLRKHRDEKKKNIMFTRSVTECNKKSCIWHSNTYLNKEACKSHYFLNASYGASFL